MYYIGIDTSCYTTSVAAVDNAGSLIYDGRILLKVEQGNRGLRQSEAVFQHVNNLSTLLQELFFKTAPGAAAAVGVSTKPRGEEGSYMPVFTAGINAARILSSSLQIPVIETNHQKNHMYAGQWSAGCSLPSRYIACHISGGTSEILLVNDDSDQITLLGGSEDLKAGQFIDRIGVAMGLQFPCGAEMDKLSGSYTDKLDIPIAVRGKVISFSGPETYVQRLLKQSSSLDATAIANISYSVFHCIGSSLERAIANAVDETKLKDVLIVGGVASNSVIKAIIASSPKLKKRGTRVIFSDPRYSSDNAAGTALIARNAMKSGREV